MTRIVLHLERLVLAGIGREHREMFEVHLRREFVRQLASGEAFRALAARANVPHLNVETVRAEGDAPPARIGADVARGIARAMKS